MDNTFGVFIISFLIVAMALIEYIILIEVPRKAEDYLKETYPEYSLENVN